MVSAPSKCCSGCTAIVQRLLGGRVEEKSGPGAIFGKYRCFFCWKSHDVTVDHPHNLNLALTTTAMIELVARVRSEIGVVVPCSKCGQLEDEAAGKAIKTVIVYHNCGRPN